MAKGSKDITLIVSRTTRQISQDKRREEERRYARPQRHLGNSFPVRFQQKITTGLQGQRNMGSIVPKEEIYVN